jgi:hypothetical protein
LDARKSAETLLGIDEVIRYFLYQVDPEIQQQHIEIPVLVEKGSWEALIPSDISQWLIAGGAAALYKYGGAAMS